MATLQVRRLFWPIPPPTIEYDKPQETIYKGPERIHTIIVQIIKSFF